jgi:hypothetical protein
MSGLGKLITAAVSRNTEVQASHASFNFDFSLLKVEAPAQYAGVSSSLTSLRRRDAEDGSSHITARKLAALFAAQIPATTSLFKAYRYRATEISSSPVSKTLKEPLNTVLLLIMSELIALLSGLLPLLVLGP